MTEQSYHEPIIPPSGNPDPEQPFEAQPLAWERDPIWEDRFLDPPHWIALVVEEARARLLHPVGRIERALHDRLGELANIHDPGERQRALNSIIDGLHTVEYFNRRTLYKMAALTATAFPESLTGVWDIMDHMVAHLLKAMGIETNGDADEYLGKYLSDDIYLKETLPDLPERWWVRTPGAEVGRKAEVTE